MCLHLIVLLLFCSFNVISVDELFLLTSQPVYALQSLSGVFFATSSVMAHSVGRAHLLGM